MPLYFLPQTGVRLASPSSSSLTEFLPPSPTSSCLLHKSWAVTHIRFQFTSLMLLMLRLSKVSAGHYLLGCHSNFHMDKMLRTVVPWNLVHLSVIALYIYMTLPLERRQASNLCWVNHSFYENLESGQYNYSSSLLKANGEIMQTVFEEKWGKEDNMDKKQKESSKFLTRWKINLFNLPLLSITVLTTVQKPQSHMQLWVWWDSHVFFQ